MLRLRKQVDQIDQRLLRLLQQRTKLSGKIGRAKLRHGAEIYVPDRERELLARMARLANGRLPPAAVAAIFREILSSSRAAQGQPPIGVLAASAEEVLPFARSHFGACDVFVAARGWRDLARQLEAGKLAIGLLTFADLALILRQRWPAGFTIIGQVARAKEGDSIREAIFIVKASGGEIAGNRALILIECKPTPDTVKSLVSAMPRAPKLVQFAPLSRGAHSKKHLAALTFHQPVTAATVAEVQEAGSILGIYPASESYGG